ncbi:hypothetical protein ABD05_05990 [Burkholderia pyrrocinia]|nr:hypothetical protein ABD05_05990 [Burkholderia pyrrocinia]
MIANALQAPEWISSGATITGGLDLLGLRLPGQTIGGTLLDGVTTVPPRSATSRFDLGRLTATANAAEPIAGRRSLISPRVLSPRWSSETSSKIR